MNNHQLGILVPYFGISMIIFLVTLPFYLKKIKRNYFFGMRTQKALYSDENWYAINRLYAVIIFKCLVAVMLTGIILVYIPYSWFLKIPDMVHLLYPGVMGIFVPTTIGSFYEDKLY